jgi:hypothetical protein
VEIKEDFITKEEQTHLLEWAEEQRPLLKANPMGKHRYSRPIRDLSYNEVSSNVLKRVLQEYNLKDRIHNDGFIGSILSYQTDGAFVHSHTDEIEDKRHLRFNLFLSVPESGGVPIYNGEEIPIKERLLIPYEADRYFHSSTPVVGNKPRIIISFGWAFND